MRHLSYRYATVGGGNASVRFTTESCCLVVSEAQIAEADNLVHPPDMDHCSLIETSVAFAEVRIKFECAILPFFKDTPFGERLFEWQE